MAYINADKVPIGKHAGLFNAQTGIVGDQFD